MDVHNDLPDFGIVSDHLSTVAVHLGRCKNLPAVDGGAHVTQLLQPVVERVSALERAFERQSATLQSMDQTLKSIDHGMQELKQMVNASQV